MARLLLIVGLAAVLAEIVLATRANQQQRRWLMIGKVILGAFAAANLGILVYLFANHINFPLNLDVMEGTILQHFQRAVAFKPIYTDPAPDFVAFAYNPFYYVVSIPFGLIFGVNLVTLRLVSILAFLGSMIILYAVVQRRTQSVWWALMAAGLFAAAYRVMDAYLDTAHSDSTFVFFALLGSYLIDRSQSRTWSWLGVVCLLLSFWTKQHGALFAIGGLFFLTWREGFIRSIPYWLTAVLLGPVCYIFVGPWLFGPRFLYFTWEVPRQWTEINRATFIRYFSFIASSYLILAIASVLETAWTLLIDIQHRSKVNVSIWHVQFAFALLSGLMGALDPGSSDNVFIPMGVFFILVGTLGLYHFATQVKQAEQFRIYQIGLVVTFFLLFYNPQTLVIPSTASASFDDLVATLNKLDGPVYAPSLGQLQRGFTFSPTAHWVALEDMIRGPGRDERNNPLVEALLTPVTHPDGPAYILSNYPIDTSFAWLDFLTNYYVVQTDFGDRFAALKTLPKRFDHGYPRYLYRYDPAAASQLKLSQATF